ncbi:uncharacterized protein PGTG_07570 [Puccinia graminis f. sp. tritici CRL 75-36-700-3]|uniref:Uncharacterized protein n=1 Tax=Puccinia graminis f. sp. tritici (strain CRL 75-36-700-3 / race SCCL) TaxID=418459 RepID=E3KCM1_PUCGT|nr:uncharacterized protein PGTG_07570 [Puccinia graminis f. sp. tritici CRL 75-36-700-3]EFP82173.1 hypothetical protein PGTG_07570 [Puccinia graminis f. sp. tritici CRL 75-36-700-3]
MASVVVSKQLLMAMDRFALHMHQLIASIEGSYPSSSCLLWIGLGPLAGYGSARHQRMVSFGNSNQLLLVMDRHGLHMHHLCIGFGIFWSNPISICVLWFGGGFLIHEDKGIVEAKQLLMALDWLGIKGLYPSESRIQRALARSGYGSARAPHASIVHRIRNRVVESDWQLFAMDWLGFPYPWG